MPLEVTFMKTQNEREVRAAVRQSEQRENRVKAAIEEWVTLIDDYREEPSISDFELTMRVQPKRSDRSH